MEKLPEELVSKIFLYLQNPEAKIMQEYWEERNAREEAEFIRGWHFIEEFKDIIRELEEEEIDVNNVPNYEFWFNTISQLERPIKKGLIEPKEYQEVLQIFFDYCLEMETEELLTSKYIIYNSLVVLGY